MTEAETVSPHPARSATSRPADGAEVDERTVTAFLDAARVLVGIGVHSVNAAPVELTVTQYRLLAVVAARGPVTVSEVASLLGVAHSNASRHCDRLQRLGLLDRTRSTEDRRVVLVHATEAGRGVVDHVTELRRAQLRRVLGSMTPTAQQRVLRAAEEFNRAAGGLDELPWLRAAW